jgi:putative copper resistance protein D
VIEAAIVVARALQYAGASILFGSALFHLYALPAPRVWSRPLLASAAAVLAVASVAAVAAQASLFAGSWSDGLTREAIGAVLSSMAFGKAAVVRAAAALLALALLAVLRGRTAWVAGAVTGAVAAASLAWMGHAAASESLVHLIGDAIHAVAAAAWIGALVALLALSAKRGDDAGRAVLHRALLRFSAIGPALVAAIMLSGLLNAWVLVGPDHVTALSETGYGRALLVKLALFAAMLALAAANRFRLTKLAARPGASLGPLRRSLALETGAGLMVLAAVAWLGTQVPPAVA